ncbi:hypothetical protein EHI8A_040290 [Entamoeba histolytica HM-1:IMSS-B]|uniref:Uncharacterized protein n=6 Tax=Entamoeba histolytica TaxID=5759 RepID=C4MA74_ENTH1|nr:hypothetical protein EHI_075180 [Entamoeba histolytica HM-1:IMSS]EMD47522.1 Hypothetical protein EHI5A_069700 [Entamoeba histolytica KU27]EMH76203.1 hypothetical protein EHI8A_040290 [Entamoeba histolytica HM-1:IMSS-B]EMS15881.1 hypothetical protein KM1_082460 [Entamoeba histolytica HM-3:IMSS]ENY62432.1 hypothetical protein EHI7A_041570 [Entamoeba histolytica HM-1:IMSS-A]GAT98664.1 hypothetical protein CL6EHI_075180 [Entamoeba histolytica]|eukprot:XP_648867.1 hypothetical protein EHI_075180 [Entamoeba histolytica HM-1:IMSS]
MEDARAILKKIQTPIQRNVSRCGLTGVIFGLCLMFIGLILLIVLLCWPETLVYWERNKCFAMQSSLGISSIDRYVNERLRAVIIDTRSFNPTNQTYFNDFVPFYTKAINQKLDVYMAMNPDSISSINTIYSSFEIKGVFVDQNNLKNPEEIRYVFDQVNEHKVKRNNQFISGLITEFGGIVDRYYYDCALFMVHSKISSEVLSLTQQELKKGITLIGFRLSDFNNDITQVFDIANYVDTFCDSNANFFGYVIMFD